MKKIAAGSILVIILSVWAIRPIAMPGFFPMHDDTQVGRVIAMGRALRLGQFPVRWVLDLGYGYGYPIFNFYGPLPYYFGGALYALGVPGLIATKAMFIAGVVGAGIAMFGASSAFLGVTGALVAAIFYVYAPYHAVQVYVRGAVGEFWFLIFLPIILSGIAKRRVLVTGLGLAGAILSHTVLGYATTLMYVLGVMFAAIVARRGSTVDAGSVWRLLTALALALGGTAFFWLPAAAEMRFTSVVGQVGKTANFSDHFVCLPQLWDSLWGYGGSAIGCVDGLSFKLGKLHSVLSLIAVALWFIFGRMRHTTSSRLVYVSMVVAMIGMFFVLSVSEPVWMLMPGFAYIQYPWRFLTYAIAAASLLVGSLCIYIKHRLIKWATATVLCISVIALQQKVFVPQYIYSRNLNAFESDTYLRYEVSKISDEYLPRDIIRPKSEKQVIRDTIRGPDTSRVKIERDTDTSLRFSIITDNPQVVEVMRTYFPGWRYRVNGKYVEPMLSHGLPRLAVPAGYSVIEIDFVDTPVRTIGNAVSVLTAAVLITIYGKKAKKPIT